jgi:hypothetical protein
VSTFLHLHMKVIQICKAVVFWSDDVMYTNEIRTRPQQLSQALKILENKSQNYYDEMTLWNQKNHIAKYIFCLIAWCMIELYAVIHHYDLIKFHRKLWSDSFPTSWSILEPTRNVPNQYFYFVDLVLIEYIAIVDQ